MADTLELHIAVRRIDARMVISSPVHSESALLQKVIQNFNFFAELDCDYPIFPTL